MYLTRCLKIVWMTKTVLVNKHSLGDEDCIGGRYFVHRDDMTAVLTQSTTLHSKAGSELLLPCVPGLTFR